MDQLRGNVATITYPQLLKEKNQYVLVDVRTPTEFKDGHIDGSVNIPVDDLRDRYTELPQDKELVTICRVGMRGYIGARILMQHGFKVKNLAGGMLSVNAQL
jgi:rhodanese-related sulfurtransferase